jgi:hypothetical protein
MQPLEGEEGRTTPTSLTSRGKTGGIGTLGGRLRNPFLNKPFFTGNSVFFFARASPPVTLRRTGYADSFEASNESARNPSFQTTERSALSSLALLKYC